MQSLNVTADRCDPQGSRDVYRQLYATYNTVLKVIKKLKSLYEGKAVDGKKITELQKIFVQQNLLDPASEINDYIKNVLGPLLLRINELAKSDRKVDKLNLETLLRLSVCKNKDAHLNIMDTFIQDAEKEHVHAAAEEAKEDDEDFVPIADDAEEPSIGEEVAVESEEALLTELWEKREVAESLMKVTDGLFDQLNNEEIRDKLPQALKVKVASFMEDHKDIEQSFDRKDKLLKQAQEAVSAHFQMGELFTQGTIGLIVRLIKLFDAIIVFAMAGSKLAEEVEGKQVMANVILGGADLDYNMLNVMEETLSYLQEAPLVENC